MPHKVKASLRQGVTMGKLEGKIAVVTGGNSGIGLAAARLFRDEGATVVIVTRTLEAAEHAKKETHGKFDVVKADVRKIEEIDALVKIVKDKYGRIDVLFANAGISRFAPTENTSEAFFDDHFDTNVRGLFFTVSKSLPLLSPGASIILNASVMGSKGISTGSVYSATKAAVRSFARSWTAELAPRGIRCNVLSPGPIETPIYAKMGMSESAMKGFSTYLQSQIPAGRMGRPDEMAKAALFLASSDSSYCFGVDLCADGGYAQI
jgi:NAD(P)-dependent dehydrogenase (short-subunit alcohol dehydrogenase family)